MIDYKDYLRLLPKTELHCHFTSTLSAEHFVRLAGRYGIDLPTTDPERLFDFADLSDFLQAFRKAHEALRTRHDFFQVAYDGVRYAVGQGGLRYREYYINPQYFWSRGLTYSDLMEPIIDGLRAAERDFGVGFRIVAAITRYQSPMSAVELVEQVIAFPFPEVVGIGMDDLTPEGTEDPMRFAEAYSMAKRAGLFTAAHVGETDNADAEAVRIAIEELRVDRVDHGYRITDDPHLLERARESQVPFATTPISTMICSGWQMTPDHRIAAMIRAGLNVTVSSDDSMFFRTDVGREYYDALLPFGVASEGAKRIAMAGIDAAFCDDDTKARLRSQFSSEFLALDSLLDHSTV